MPITSVPQGLWVPPRIATLFVAASDALDRSRAQADFTCDGVADDVQINAALAALPAGIGGRVVLSEGTFNIVDPITIPVNNITLRGQGESTFIDGDGLATGEHGIVISAKTSCTIKRLGIQTQDGGLKVCHCIFIENGSNGCHIEEVVIDASDSDGIHIEGTTMYDISIHDVTVNSADGYGIYSDVDAANFLYRSHVSNSLILATGNSGIFVGNTGNNHYCEINNNLIFQAGGQGIQALNMHHSDLSNNLLLNCTSDGIIIGTSDHCDLEGNQCWSNGSDGIELATAVECILDGNMCTANTTSGINLDGASDLNLIEANHCCDNTLDGIRCGGTRVSIVGNFCHENDQHGINAGNPECQINNNYCYDNSQESAGTYHGINVGVDADRSQICGNHIADPGDSTEDGIHLVDGAAQCQINGNFIYNMMGSGVCLTANNLDTQINGNHCEACDDYGIEVLAGCDRSIVNNNKCYANGNHGIYVFRTDYCSVTGNVCNGNTGTADGIHVEGDATGNADYNTISSNVCTGNADDGVEVAGGANANKNIVLGNQLLNNTGTALVDSGTNTEIASNISV